MAETTTPKKRGRKAAAAGQPVTQEVVVMVPLAELHPFPDHPFQVRDDESMRETAASVKENGVIIPGLVRPREEGGYQGRFQRLDLERPGAPRNAGAAVQRGNEQHPSPGV